MANWKKTMMAAAGGADALNVEDVFSTYLYEGNNGTAQSITNGIDLSTEGGFVWIKQRTQNNYHYLFDTEATSNTHGFLLPLTIGKSASTTALTSFNSDGFSLGSNAGVNGTHDMASWTFRKAPKFFDIVTYTGNGTSGRTVSHNLGCDVGCMIIKDINNSNSWVTFHRGVGATKYLELNGDTNGLTASWMFNNTAPTSSVFTLGNNVAVNYSGREYVAYLFAHNNSDGEFGPTGDQDIIKCGSYTGNNSSNGPTIDLGFEPQWLMVKRSDASGSWQIMDNMRGMFTDLNDYVFLADSIDTSQAAERVRLLGNGFKIDTANTQINAQNGTYVYIAIRRGPMAVPENASDVFNVQSKAENGYYGYIGKPVDLWMNRPVNSPSDMIFRDRLRGSNTLTNTSSQEATGGVDWYSNNEGAFATTSTDTNHISWTWRRAPNFFDVVAYTGTPTTVSHNLGVAPEMIWIKRRNATYDWMGAVNVNGDLVNLSINSSAASYVESSVWDSQVSSTDFTRAKISRRYNGGSSTSSNDECIAYLFASLDGISKVGSYTGNGSTQDISLGFSPRLFITKNTDSTYPWYLFDSERGIVAGNDPFLTLNTNGAQGTLVDMVDPITNGIRLINSSVNNSGDNYIYYAIA